MTSAPVTLSNGFADAIEKAAQSVAFVREGGRVGVSGTIWKDDLVVTTEHTIHGQKELNLVLPGGESTTATVIGRDPSTDIAVLRLAQPTSAKAEFADLKKIRVGHLVLAIGRRVSDGMVATQGMISAVGGQWRTWRGGRVDLFLRLELLPFTGFSGGPLVDAEGRVIGINTSGPRRSVTTLPSSTVNRVIEQVLTSGHVKRGFIGVALQPVPLHQRTKDVRQSNRGLLTVMVEPNSPAEKAGLLVGDILVGLQGEALNSAHDLQSALDVEQIGKTFTVSVLRGGKTEDISVQIAEHK